MRHRCVARLSPFLAAFGLTGCHPSQMRMEPLPGSPRPVYLITDLGVGSTRGINNSGQVVGHFPAGEVPNSHGFPYFHGCLWNGGKRTEMPTLGGWESEADSVNDGGQVLGTSTVAGMERPGAHVTHPCLWDGHTLTNLDADPRFRGTSAVHMTTPGAVYAVSPPQGQSKQRHLWFYPAGFGPGVRRDFGVVGGSEIKPLFINDNGMVIGTWGTGEKHNAADTLGVRRAFAWQRGDKKWTDLGTLGGRDSEPAALNSSGQVVGDADLRGDPVTRIPQEHAFLWEKGKMRDLGTLPGGRRSRPCAINRSGQIAGYSDAKGNDRSDRPVLWEHGRIEDLSLLIPSGTPWVNLNGASGINDRGQIVGDGIVGSDHHGDTFRSHGYLLTPR